MQIHAFSIPVPHVNTGPTTTSGSTSTTSNAVQGTDSMFMQLLTAQLQNQSPLDPVDPMQFTSQLVQFNMLDQLTQINSALQQNLGNPSTPSANGSVTIPGGH